MKKIIAVIAAISVILFFGCAKKTPDDKETTSTDESNFATKESESNNGESEDETEFTTPDAEQVVQQRARGCYYGKNTGTKDTFTGLEPLPLSDFGNPSFENDKHLSTETVSHSYGVASEEKPHQISVDFQKFFDDNGFDALCYDSHTAQKVVYLTFDCGYENGYTAKILDTLRDKDVKAAFFCTLPEMRENTEIIARMINEGHIVGNHSVTHPDFSSLSREEMYEEVKGFDDYLREHFGYSAAYFRFPQGKYSENALDMLNQMGYTCIFWSLAYVDWDLNDQKGADYAFDTVMSRMHPGAVILLHAVSPDNANALSDIIDAVRAKGYSFRSLSDFNT